MTMDATKVRKKPLDSDKVLEFFKKRRKVLSTQDIATRFKVRPQQAAAAVAILRIKSAVEPAEPSKTLEGVSRWQLTAE
jgi:hypothetical protein